MFLTHRTTGRRARVLHQPDTLAEAAGLLRDHAGNARLIAGGSYLMLMAAKGEVQPEHLVSLRRVPGLATMEPGHVGALTTLRRLERGPRTGPDRALTMAAAVTAGPLVRTVGTLGGNVGFHDGDLIAPLLALDATAELADGGQLPVSRFVAERPPHQIITGLSYRDRAEDGWSAATVKLACRAMDWPVMTVSVAVCVDAAGVITQARVAAQALAPEPLRLPATEAVLVGSEGEPEAIEYAGQAATERVELRDDAEASAAYRRRVAPAVVARAVALAVTGGASGQVAIEEAAI